MKFIIYFIGIVMLTACAGQPAEFSQYDLEKERYFLTNRNRLPVDLADVQKSLFQHERECNVKYTFEMEPNQSSYGYVYYQPEGTVGWKDRVLITVVRLHDKSTNMRAYSYYPGQMNRVHKMFTAIMDPSSCDANTDWESSMDDDDD